MTTGEKKDKIQELAITKYMKTGKLGIFWSTGTGKTIAAIKCILEEKKTNKDFSVIVTVPSISLKDQWNSIIKSYNLTNVIVHTIQGLTRNIKEYKIDLLIVDEAHASVSNTRIKIYKLVTYNKLLLLTATPNRSDGKGRILKELVNKNIYTIGINKAVKEGFVSDYEQINVGITLGFQDMKEYNKYQNAFLSVRTKFEYNLNLMYSCMNVEGAKKYAEKIGEDYKTVQKWAFWYSKAMQGRLAFIRTHTKKIEIANKLIEHYKNDKIATYCKDVNTAELINGIQYHRKVSTKKCKEVLNNFNIGKVRVISTVGKFVAGDDIKDLGICIIVAGDGSPTTYNQARGRFIRKEGDKIAKIYNLYITNTIDEDKIKTKQKGTKATYISYKELYKQLEIK